MTTGDFDEVGEVKFRRGVVGADFLQHEKRVRARDRSWPRVTATDSALRRAGVLLFADGHEDAFPLDQASVARRIDGVEAQSGQASPVRERGAQVQERLRTDQRNVGIADQHVVKPARQGRARG